MKSDGCSKVTATQCQTPLRSIAELSEESVREGNKSTTESEAFS